MPKRELALVVSGGGARSAYQVGFLRRISREFPDLQIDILTGVSAGAINAVFLASKEENFAMRMLELGELWSELETGDVFRTDASSLGSQVLKWLRQLSSGGSPHGSKTRGFVDTKPLADFLERRLNAQGGPIPGIEKNIEHERLRAIAVTTACYSTGRSVTWVQGRDIHTWERPHRTSVHTKLTVNHILASASLPLFFPAIEIEGGWYGDGGIRLAAPLSPAVHLGAEKILAISTRYIRNPQEVLESQMQTYPPPAQVIGVLLNSIFLDLFDQDAQRLKRINRLLEYFPDHRHGTFRPIDLKVVRPTRDLGKLANDFEAKLPTAFRFLTRSLGTKEVRSNDALSMVMFQSDYINRLMEIGEQDAESQLDELQAFFEA